MTPFPKISKKISSVTHTKFQKKKICHLFLILVQLLTVVPKKKNYIQQPKNLRVPTVVFQHPTIGKRKYLLRNHEFKKTKDAG